VFSLAYAVRQAQRGAILLFYSAKVELVMKKIISHKEKEKK
jgi:hypothetical protein